MSILNFFQSDILDAPDAIAEQAIKQINGIHGYGIKFLNAFEGSIALYEEADETLVFVNVIGDTNLVGVRVPLSESVMGEAFQHGEPICAPSKHHNPAYGGPHQVMVFPLMLGQEKVGVMTCVRKADAGAFGKQDMDAFEPFARLCESSLAYAVFMLQVASTQGKEPSGYIPQIIARLYKATRFSAQERKVIRIISELEEIANTAPEGLDLCIDLVALMRRIADQVGSP